MGKEPSGVPQGTKLDPGLFLQHFQHAEIVDDTTVSETIPKGQQRKAQDLVDLIHDRSKTNLFEVNCDKTKELTISFSRQRPLFPRACIDRNSIETVQCKKLLGVMLNVNLTYNDHIEEIAT